ncbi:MAG TPA: hypothetical protein VFU97_26405 [Xanthobacteraceae bacterium]|nr:hypothetical protein [Xanthobacteraceae bacterium]
MLQKLAEHISACLERAALAERRAADSAVPSDKREFEEIAQTWRNIAASYAFSERLEQSMLETEAARKRPPAA